MAALFAITAATAEVKLDEKRQAETAFTVFNASGRYIRGRAELKAANPAAAEWLTLGGEMDRDFPVGGSVQYPVRISVPPEAPPGRYEFRLDMADVQKTEAEYTRGPAVSFQVPEPPPPPPPLPWKKWLLIGAAVVLLAAPAAWFFWPRGVEVPELANLRVEEASDTLRAHGLALGRVDTFPNEAVAAGRVISSDPSANSPARRGQAVDLFVSGGREEVAIEEDCRDFRADAVQLVTVRDHRGEVMRIRWELRVERTVLKTFDDENEARQSRELMARYEMNSQCFVGGRDRPSMEYWLTDGRAPQGSMAGEDCIAFNRDDLELRQEDNQWVIVASAVRLMSFPNQNEAQLALQIIGKYQFTHTCRIGGRQPSFRYLRR